MSAPTATKKKLNTDQYFDLNAAKKGIVFDIDGTLTDSDDFHHKAFDELLKETDFKDGKGITREWFDEEVSGGHTQTLVSKWFPDWDDQKVEDFSQRKEKRFRELADGELKPNPGLVDFLQLLSEKGVKMWAVTNADPENARFMLRVIGAADHMAGITFGEDLENTKPAPDPYAAGLKNLELEPEEVVVFEDSPSGVKAGARAGCKVVGVLTTHKAADLKEAGAQACIDDYTALLQAA